jgi:CelD/BcsL family acetyltransferase involved in cellulose biosynthesis
VEHLSLAEFDRRSAQVEQAVDGTPGIDPWCSGPDWVLSVHQGFGAASEPLVLMTETVDDTGFALLARYRLPDRRVMIAGLEPLWGFASPLVGSAVEQVTADLAEALAEQRWDILVLPGMPAATGPESFPVRAAMSLERLGPVGLAAGIVRRVADIGDGHRPWMTRRSSRFRRSLNQASRRADQAGLSFLELSTDPDVFQRILAIEARSWKGRDESGVTAPEMRTTYETLTHRLRAQGRLKVFVARLGGRDVGYILGGIRAGIYRGLQLSFVEEAASLSVGHLLQHHQVETLCDSGEATVYDLGMDLEYKARWADRAVATFTLVIDRSR